MQTQLNKIRTKAVIAVALAEAEETIRRGGAASTAIMAFDRRVEHPLMVLGRRLTTDEASARNDYIIAQLAALVRIADRLKRTA